MTDASTRNRAEERQRFLAAHGWADATVTDLQPDASFRTYARLEKAGERRMLMSAPPERENLPAYLKVNAHLQRIGLRAPRIDAADTGTGFAIIEDFGDDTFTRLLASGADEMALYLLAADVLKVLHMQQNVQGIELPPYDMTVLLRETDVFADWFIPAVRGHDLTDAERDIYRGAWRTALADIADCRASLVYRDFHVDNLMIVGQGGGILDCGLLDYQDALIGSPAYDLASLVEDARRDVSPAVRDAVLDRYFDGWAATDRARLETDMALLGAQRHAKVAGLFVRLSVRDGKNHYLGHVPRVIRLLDRCLNAPELAAVRQVIDDLVPAWRLGPRQRG